MTDSILVQNYNNINNNSPPNGDSSPDSTTDRPPQLLEINPIAQNSDEEAAKVKGYNDHDFIAQTNYLALLNLLLVNLGCFIGLFYFFLEPTSRNMVIIIYISVIAQRLNIFYEGYGIQFPSKISKTGTLIFGIYSTVMYLTLLSLFTFAYTAAWG